MYFIFMLIVSLYLGFNIIKSRNISTLSLMLAMLLFSLLIRNIYLSFLVIAVIFILDRKNLPLFFSPKKNSDMTIEEAHSLFGIKDGATSQELKKAYQTLIKRYHPDIGGEHEMAVKINKARDLLYKYYNLQKV